MQQPPTRPTRTSGTAGATRTVEDGIARAAAELPQGPERRVDRLTLRVPAGAGAAEIARALAAALRARDANGGRTGR